ncbi:MAG: DUF1648 domain-containing protein [Pseudomonadota bacterium]|nr:DUF1648 domain-containing protein [Pseudomonadota bacterium]
MQRLALAFFIVAVMGSTALVMATGPSLPTSIATHFRLDGRPNAFMSRSEYMMMFLLVVALVPVALGAGTALITRKAPRLLRGRDRKYVLDAGANRDAAIGCLTTRSLVMGALLAVFLGGVHFCIVQANAVQPPRLPPPAFHILLATFVVMFAGTGLLFRFRLCQPPSVNTSQHA